MVLLVALQATSLVRQLVHQKRWNRATVFVLRSLWPGKVASMSDENEKLMADAMIDELRLEGDSLRDLIKDLQAEVDDLQGKLRHRDNAVRLTIEAVVKRAEAAEKRAEAAEARAAKLDHILRWIAAFTWAGSTNPRMTYDPIYVERQKLEQILEVGGYVPAMLVTVKK